MRQRCRAPSSAFLLPPTPPTASAALPRRCRRRRRGGRADPAGRRAPGRRTASARASRRGSTRSMLRWRALVICSTRSRHRSTKRLAPLAVLAEDRRSAPAAPLPDGCSVRLGHVLDRAAEVGDRVAQPAQLHVLAVDDVLVGVVEVVVGDEARAGDVALPQRRPCRGRTRAAARAVRQAFTRSAFPCR